jgi:hypothetical protein
MDDKKENKELSEFTFEEFEQDSWAWGQNLEAMIRQRKVKELPINSWKYVNQLRDEMIEDSDNLESLEPAWERLNELYDGIFDRVEDGHSFKLPIDELIYQVSSGFYPRPELLVAVVSCFERYFSNKGEIELEEAFFVKSTKRIGNYSALQSSHPDLKLLESIVRRSKSPFSQKKGIRPLTLNEAAEQVINELKLDIDPESLLRKYRRYKDNKD